VKVDFKKVAKTRGEFSLERIDNRFGLIFEGTYFKNNYGLVEIDATLRGKLSRECDICGEDSLMELSEELKLFVSDSLYKSDEFLDVIEFLDGVIDFDLLFEGEIESIKTMYFSCANCDK